MCDGGCNMAAYRYSSHNRVYHMGWRELRSCLKREESRIVRIVRNGIDVAVIWTNSAHNLKG